MKLLHMSLFQVSSIRMEVNGTKKCSVTAPVLIRFPYMENSAKKLFRNIHNLCFSEESQTGLEPCEI